MIPRCFYCGVDATTKDHVVPISWYRTNNKKNKFRGQEKNLVPACKECNTIAGNKVFDDREKKREYIQSKLENKYIRVLKIPDWSNEDLAELSQKLRKDTMLKMLAKQWILNRIAYPNIIYPEEPIRAQMKKIMKLF